MKRITNGTINAGGYTRWLLEPLMDMLTLRVLVDRGRAASTPTTPPAVARLLHATRSTARTMQLTPIPDPVVWNVLEFAFGTKTTRHEFEWHSIIEDID